MAIQMRRGLKEDFDPAKMLPGEWAVSIDSDTNNQIIWMCFRAGVVKRMGTYEDFKAQIEEATGEIREEYLEEFQVILDQIEELAEQTSTNTDTVIQIRDDTVNTYLPQMLEYLNGTAENARIATEKVNEASDYARQSQSYAEEAKEAAENADISETNAETYATKAKTSETNAKISETTAAAKATEANNSAATAMTSETNAKEYANTATIKANEASVSATKAATASSTATSKAAEASGYATETESYAHGGTGTRENEDIDNAKYYKEQAERISEGLKGSLIPMGTIEFTELPDSSVAGYMYNIRDEFVTTEHFKEGAGNTVPAGTNVYYTADGYWDCLAGSPVTGIKGSAEQSYRRGNVEITAEDFGLGNVDNTSDLEKPVSNKTQEALNSMKKEIINMLYPIGSIYISTKSDNPATLFPGTSWQSFGTGRTLVGVNTNDANFNTVEKTGGSASVTLTTANLPSHSHGLNSHTHSVPALSGTAASAGSHSHTLAQTGKQVAGGNTYAKPLSYSSYQSGEAPYTGYVSNSAGAHTHTVTTTPSTTGGNSGSTTAVGSGAAHNNLQPYITVHMWKRIQNVKIEVDETITRWG